jgi:hypothetical protein
VPIDAARGRGPQIVALRLPIDPEHVRLHSQHEFVQLLFLLYLDSARPFFAAIKLQIFVESLLIFRTKPDF